MPTLYVENDEEITSIIERIRQTPESSVCLIVPPMALVLQSVVNLRLLLREAQKANKKISVATSDEDGARIVEKAGIEIKSFTNEEDDKEDLNQEGTQRLSIEINKEHLQKKGETQKTRDIGSPSFFAREENEDDTEEIIQENKDRVEEKNTQERSCNTINIQKDKVQIKQNMQQQERPLTRTLPERKERIDTRNMERIPQKNDTLLNKELISRTPSMEDIRKKKTINFNVGLKKEKERETPARIDDFSPEKEKALKEFFEDKKRTDIQKNTNPYNKKRDGKETIKTNTVQKKSSVWNIAIVTTILIILAGGAFLITQKRATVAVVTQPKEINVTTPLSADTANEITAPIIKAHVIEVSAKATGEAQTTGEKNISDKKARGSVIIYNEYSQEAQPLVATTRLLTEDGKLFRLVETVSVPGIKIVNEQKQPGAIEVEVIADQSGKEFNVGPGTFSIPGLDGTQREEKIYAKSTRPMIGGGEESGTIKTVSEKDIESAKENAEKELQEALISEASQKINSDETLIKETITLMVTEENTTPSREVIAQKVEHTISASAKFFVIQSNDITKIIEQKAEKDAIKLSGEVAMEISYNKIQTNAQNTGFSGEVKAKITYTPNINTQKFQQDIAGKTREEIGKLLEKEYQNIEKIEMRIWPPFNQKTLPKNPEKIVIEIKS
ncbi:MAG: hypothetical protein KC736_04280 [Candidatus Moranbacteria bacterium]|nr:hypothetical protein [Candidatus Moranbacteria bacterium]